MDTIGIIASIIEYTKKAEELTDEQQSLGLTCNTLFEIIKDIDTQKLPKELMKNLQSHLEESKQLLESTNAPQSKFGSIIQNIKNMIPGSKLQQIKEKNMKLLELSHLISVHLQSRQFKKQLSSEIETDIDTCPLLKRPKDSDNNSTVDKAYLLGPTLITQQELATLREEDEKSSNNQTDIIGELKLIANNDVECIFSKNSQQALTKINLELNTKKWLAINKEINCNHKIVHAFERESYLFLDQLARYFSRLHAVIIAKETIINEKQIDNNQNKQIDNNQNKQIDNNQNKQIDNNQNKQIDNNQKDNDSNLLQVQEEQKVGDLFMTVAENLDDDEEDKSKKSFQQDNKKVQVYICDKSSNGTYILKKQFWYNVTGEQNNPLNTNTQWQKIQKNIEIEIEVGDIIGLILDKTTHTKLILGYMFQ